MYTPSISAFRIGYLQGTRTDFISMAVKILSKGLLITIQSLFRVVIFKALWEKSDTSPSSLQERVKDLQVDLLLSIIWIPICIPFEIVAISGIFLPCIGNRLYFHLSQITNITTIYFE